MHLEPQLRAARLPAVAIEVDGPHHFSSNGGAPLGRTLLRDRLLAARGWRVVGVRASDWRRLRTPSEQRDYMQEALRAAGVPLERFLGS